MENNEQFRSLLAQVEKRLRERAQQALADGEYARARGIVELLDRLLEAAKVAIGGLDDQAENVDLPDQTQTSDVSARQATRVVVEESTERNERDYPFYARDGDQLVKIGWSKKNDDEYRHRAPKKSVLAVRDRIRDVVSEKRKFDRDDLDPIEVEGEVIPDYQLYLCLGWLRWSGLVNRLGRRGYTVPNLKQFKELSTSAWNQLPQDTAA